DDGPPGVVGEIEMLSTGKNSRESILKLIEFSPGMPLTHARLMQIKKRLYDSARFARFDVRPQPPAEPAQARTGRGPVFSAAGPIVFARGKDAAQVAAMAARRNRVRRRRSGADIEKP